MENNNMPSIVMSICIPTYNRSKLVSECIKRIIPCQSQEIEIIVSDNASPDGTQDEVKKIRDPRIKYYRNDKNLGFDANILKLVERATGDFLFFLSDEDYIELEAIHWILKTIKGNRNGNITQILGSISDKRPGYKKIYYAYKDKILKSGHESLMELLFKNPYMSGIILKRQILDLNPAKKYIGFAYMLEVLQAQAMTSGSTLCTSKIFVHIGPDDKNYIFMTKGNVNIKGKPYYDPTSRVYQIKERIKLISDITNEMLTQKALLNRERKKAALFLTKTFIKSFSSFRQIFSLVLNIKELSKSPLFWINIPLYFPRRIVRYFLNRWA